MSFGEQRTLSLASYWAPLAQSLVCSLCVACATANVGSLDSQQEGGGAEAESNMDAGGSRALKVADDVVYQQRDVPYEPVDAADRALLGSSEQAEKADLEFARVPRSSPTPLIRSQGNHISALIRAGKLRAALASLEHVTAGSEPKKDLPFADLAALVLRLAVQRSDVVELLSAIRRVEDLLSSSRQTLPVRDRVLFSYLVEVTAALVAVQARDLKQARTRLMNAHNLLPNREEHCLLSARLWIDEREWGAAEETLDQCQAHLVENSADFYALLVFVKQARGKGRAGSVALRRALDLYPDDPVLTVIAAKNEFDRGNRVRSCQQFESLYRSGEGGLVGAHYAAICALERNDVKTSKNVLEKAHLRFGASGHSAQMLFGLYALEGREQAALEAVRKGSDTLSSREFGDFQSSAALLVERLESLPGVFPGDPARKSKRGGAWVTD